MKIIYATDVHGYFERVKILLDETPADVYIIAGDLIDIPFYTMGTAMNYHELQTFFHSLRRKMAREDLYIEDFIDSLLDASEITEEVRAKGTKYQEYTDRARRVMRQKYRVLENMMSFKPGAKVYCLPGNYDMNLKFTALHSRDLHLHAYDIGGLKIAGYGGADLWTPGVPEKYVIHHNAGIGVDVEKNEMYQFFKANAPDIIAVHQPAHGIRDRVTTYGTSGSPSLRAYCDSHDVLLCLFGHVHNEWGVQEPQGTVYLNPSIFGEVTELSGRVAEGGFFYQIELEGREIGSILYRKLVERKIYDIAEYVRSERKVAGADHRSGAVRGAQNGEELTTPGWKNTPISRSSNCTMKSRISTGHSRRRRRTNAWSSWRKSPSGSTRRSSRIWPWTSWGR